MFHVEQFENWGGVISCLQDNNQRSKDMTRKDYKAFAEMLSKYLEDANTTDAIWTWSNLCQDIADVFKADNARFDYETFYTACGWDEAHGHTWRTWANHVGDKAQAS